MSSDGNYYYQLELEKQRAKEEEDRRNREYEENLRKVYDTQISQISSHVGSGLARSACQYSWSEPSRWHNY